MPHKLLVPPLRFQTVQPNLHRGSYPREINFPYLKRLSLRTMISLTPVVDDRLTQFCLENNITQIHIQCSKEKSSGKAKRDKKGTLPVTYEQITHTLQIIIKSPNSPVYVHCLNGGQVTSLVIACLRKLSLWSSVSIFNEFMIFNNMAISVKDRKFIEEFKLDKGLIIHESQLVPWLWKGLSKDVVDNHPTLSNLLRQ